MFDVIIGDKMYDLILEKLNCAIREAVTYDARSSLYNLTYIHLLNEIHFEAYESVQLSLNSFIHSALFLLKK